MKRVVRGATGYTTSSEYIKSRLFDLLCDFYGAEIDGEPAHEIEQRIEKLRPYYDIDDVITLMQDENVSFTEAIRILEDDLAIS